MKKWVKRGQEYLLQCKWLTVRKDIVKLPSGLVLDDYYVLEYPTWVNVIAITEDGLFVIEKQYRHGTESIDFEICAGTCEKDEEPIDAAKRELLEETGYGGGKWTMYGISTPNPAAMTNLNYTFLAEGVLKTSHPHQEKTEDIEVFTVSRDELLKLMENGEINQGCMLAMLWKYMAKTNSNNAAVKRWLGKTI